MSSKHVFPRSIEAVDRGAALTSCGWRRVMFTIAAPSVVGGIPAALLGRLDPFLLLLPLTAVLRYRCFANPRPLMRGVASWPTARGALRMRKCNGQSSSGIGC